MFKFLRKILIPGKHNSWRPHVFRHQALSLYSIGLLLSQFSFGLILYPPVATNTEVLDSQIFTAVNQERIEAGVSPLAENTFLEAAATAKMNDMFVKGYWDHTAPDGIKAWFFIDQTGYQYSIAGENLARGFTSAASMTAAWMKSPTHRANILNQVYLDTGIAVGNGIIDGKLTTIAVQLFGNPSPALADNKTLIAGEKSSILAPDISNPVSENRLPFFVLYAIIFGLIIFDGIMLKVNSLHKSRKHRFGFRLSLALNVVALFLLLVSSVSIY